MSGAGDEGELPAEVAAGAWAEQARTALRATRPCGAALLALRGRAGRAEEEGDQLKTAIDLAAEGWVVGYIRGTDPGAAILAEESYERGGGRWEPPAAGYWTVDALDGTRSYVEGYDGFCVQAAWVRDGRVRAGVVCEPVGDAVYLAAEGCGAWKQEGGGPWRRLSIAGDGAWPAAPRFVDSTPPGGPVGELMAQRGGVFVECGSIGLKICRVADGSAEVYAKALRFKLWDVAPGELVLAEAGGRLGTWRGETVAYEAPNVYYRNVLATGEGVWPDAVAALRPFADHSPPGSTAG